MEKEQNLKTKLETRLKTNPSFLVQFYLENEQKYDIENEQNLKTKLETRLKTNPSLSCFKFDDTFIQVFLEDLSMYDQNHFPSIHKLIQDYFKRENFNFLLISTDFKEFFNSCLLSLVTRSEVKTTCLRKFLNWFFFKLMHSFDFIKTEWQTWKDEMKRPFDKDIEVNINKALIKACLLGKHELVFEFLNKGFEIYDKDFKEHKDIPLENQYNQRHLETFRATSSSSYLLANFCYKYKRFKHDYGGKCPSTFEDINGEDVFSSALYNMMIAKNLRVDKYDLSEYAKLLKKIVNEGREFVTDIVSMCENLEV